MSEWSWLFRTASQVLDGTSDIPEDTESPEREQRRFSGVEMLVDLWVHACSYGDRADLVVTALQRAVRYCGTADGELESSSFRSRICVKPKSLWLFGLPL